LPKEQPKTCTLPSSHRLHLLILRRYFCQWLQRYRALHHSWVSSVLPTANIPSSSTGGYRSRDLWERLNPCQDRRLKYEFNSAKAKFLSVNASMRLDISDEMRRNVLVISNVPPQEIHGTSLYLLSCITLLNITAFRAHPQTPLIPKPAGPLSL
jgi:hypothetical protein